MDMNEIEEAPAPEDFMDESPNPAQDANLAELCFHLQKSGITQVVVRYQGSGDSGSAEEVDVTPPDTSLPAGAEDKLRDLAESYCPDGYENNEGGYGTLTVYPLQGLAVLEHYDRYEDSEVIDLGTPPRLPKNLQKSLSVLGVGSITARFDGYGDSGQIDEITIEPDTVSIDPELWEKVESFLLDHLPGGWEINEGGYGNLAVDVPAGQVHVDAYWRTEGADPRLTRWKWRK